MTDFSILDLSFITEGSDAGTALRRSSDLARHAEALGFKRYWVAEHHGRAGIASAATAVLIGYLAEGTQHIRIGAGGIMLPNHAPFIIAEQFGTLAALYPGRIDLGLGRAPGTDPATSRALRRRAESAEDFPQDVMELLHYFEPAQPGQMVVATPGAGSDVPVWLLGSSLYSAQLAAVLGLPFAFASHFAPQMMEEAAALYRARFRPSERLSAPHLMLGVNVVAADTAVEADWLATSQEQYVVALRRGDPRALPPPAEIAWTPAERAVIDSVLACRFVGDPAMVAEGLAGFIARHKPEEVIVATAIFDHEARVHSLELTARAVEGL
jgi:luciferase family oxidoreductase group 1